MVVLNEKESKAWELADEVHRGQKRRDGHPYMDHINKTVEMLRAMGVYDEDLTIVAILHDTLENSAKGARIKYLKQILGTFGDDVASMVMTLTHTKKDSRDYQQYIDDVIKTESKVILVKIADMLQNTFDDPTPKQMEKYRIAFPKFLIAVGDKHKWKK
jgi:GTP pyrophosphokinase